MPTNQDIIDIIEDFRASDLVELRISDDDLDLTIRRPGMIPAALTPAPAVPAVAVPAAPRPVAETAPSAPSATATQADTSVDGERSTVVAPTVGTFWEAPAPGSAPFVGVGDVVAAGQTLAIVEVMKLMTDVKAAQAGKVVAIPVENGQFVEAQQILFELIPV